MIKIEENKVIIEFKNMYSIDLCEQIKESIILAIQNLDYKNGDPEHIEFITGNLSELLKHLVIQEPTFD